MSEYTFLQLHIDALMYSNLWDFLESRYGAVDVYETTPNKVIVRCNGENGIYTSGIYVEFTTKGYNIYKTTRDGEVDQSRHLFGFYNNSVTSSTAAMKADSQVEYSELSWYIVEPVLFTIYKKYTHKELGKYIDSEVIFKKTGVRENSYNVLAKNHEKFYMYIKEVLAEIIAEKGLDTDYTVLLNQYGYVSLQNYSVNVESTFMIAKQEPNEELYIIGLNNRQKGFKIEQSCEFTDDLLYCLNEVLTDFNVKSSYTDIHKKVLKDRVLKELDNYLSK